MSVDYLTLDDLMVVIDEYDLPPVGDLGLLESAVRRAETSVGGVDAYPTLDLKAAVLLESIVRNHPLVDGNKRLGWIAAVLFLRRNDIRVRAPHDAAYDLVIGVAEGRIDHLTVADTLASWF